MNQCPKCGGMQGMHGSILPGCVCRTKTMPFPPAFQSEEIEEMSKDTSGPAFSSGTDFYGGPNGKEVGNRGMTLRDYFAAKAMQGMLAASENYPNDELAKYAYQVADSMLKAREA